MKRTLFSAIAVTAMGFISAPASAGTEALISFHGADNGSWERRAAVQDLLRGSYGFDRVKVLVDATAEEVPKHVRRFLERPARPGDRRLVWVSGLKGTEGKTICPGPAAQPIRPAAVSLVLAPGCYTDVMRFPQGARHYGMTAPVPRTASARLGRIDATDPALVAMVSLPVGEDRFVAGADALIFGGLKSEKNAGILDPGHLLRVLRAGFRWNGSAYTPALDMFYRGTETDALGPFGFLPEQGAPVKLDRVRPVKRKRAALRVHETPAPHGATALTVRKAGPVRVLRSDRSGAMRYVAIGDNLFGWVRSHDLRL